MKTEIVAAFLNFVQTMNGEPSVTLLENAEFVFFVQNIYPFSFSSILIVNSVLREIGHVGLVFTYCF